MDADKENKRRNQHHHHYGSASSNESTNSSSDDIYDNEDDQQDEAITSYAAQVEHLQEYEDALFDCCQDILANKEPILTKQLRGIVKQAQDTVDYDQEKFVNDMKTNLIQRQQMLDELQRRLQAFDDCLRQEEQVAAAQRIKKQQTNSFMFAHMFQCIGIFLDLKGFFQQLFKIGNIVNGSEMFHFFSCKILVVSRKTTKY